MKVQPKAHQSSQSEQKDARREQCLAMARARMNGTYKPQPLSEEAKAQLEWLSEQPHLVFDTDEEMQAYYKEHPLIPPSDLSK